MEDTQIIKVKPESFIDADVDVLFGECSGNLCRQRYFSNNVYRAPFKKMRNSKETIKFLENQCFELVANTILMKLDNMINVESAKIEFYRQHLFERLTPELEETINELNNPPHDMLIENNIITFFRKEQTENE